MPKLLLPISERPKRIFCAAREYVPIEYEIPDCIKFPCYIEDFGTYWQIRINGMVMYLHNIDGIDLYKDIHAGLAQYGLGLKILGDFDPLSLDALDNLSFDELLYMTADWLELSSDAVKLIRFETLRDYDPCSLGELDTVAIPGRTT